MKEYFFFENGSYRSEKLFQAFVIFSYQPSDCYCAHLAPFVIRHSPFLGSFAFASLLPSPLNFRLHTANYLLNNCKLCYSLLMILFRETISTSIPKGVAILILLSYLTLLSYFIKFLESLSFLTVKRMVSSINMNFLQLLEKM